MVEPWWQVVIGGSSGGLLVLCVIGVSSMCGGMIVLGTIGVSGDTGMALAPGNGLCGKSGGISCGDCISSSSFGESPLFGCCGE